MLSSARQRALVAAFLFVAGCAVSPDAETSSASADTASSPAALPGRFRFFARSGSPGGEVAKIVYTQPVTTRLEAVPPHAEVTITMTAYAPSARGVGYVSTATFIADDHGVVDTSIVAPTQGTYAGVDPDGLFWSGNKTNVAEGLGPDRSAAFFEARAGGAIVAKGTLNRTFVADGVTIEQVHAGGLVGEFFVPAGATDRVPVVTFGGSEGGLIVGALFAADAASLGHPALALAYFGADGVPQELANIPLEYFSKAFAWLDQRPEVRRGAVVVMGASRGGELALQLGATFANVVGVVAEAPSSYRWPGFSKAQSAAWTLGGHPLPYVPSSDDAFPPPIEGPGGAQAYAMRTVFEHDLAAAAPAALEAARIRVEDVHGPILMIGGDADQMWPSCDFANRAMAHLTESGHASAHSDEVLCLEGAGHLVDSAGAPTTDSMWADLGDGTLFALGGTAAANARAGRITQEHVRAFLDRVAR